MQNDRIKQYNGKYFSVLGDSISTLDGYNPLGYEVFYDRTNGIFADVRTPDDTWWGQVIRFFGGKLLINDSWSGSMVSKHPMCEVPSYSCSDERTSGLGRDGISPDVIMIFMGTNDRGYGMKPCAESPDEQGDLAIFGVAYREMLRKLRENYPGAEIWCITPGVSFCSRSRCFTFPHRLAGHDMAEYIKVIADYAAEYGCVFIDLYSKAKPYDTIDGLHPTADGMAEISRAVTECVCDGKASEANGDN